MMYKCLSFLQCCGMNGLLSRTVFTKIMRCMNKLKNETLNKHHYRPLFRAPLSPGHKSSHFKLYYTLAHSRHSHSPPLYYLVMSSVLIVIDQRSSQGCLPSFLEGEREGTLGTRLATDTLYLHLCSAGTTASIELFSDRGGLVKKV